jgi:hypothetical protein
MNEDTLLNSTGLSTRALTCLKNSFDVIYLSELKKLTKQNFTLNYQRGNKMRGFGLSTRNEIFDFLDKRDIVLKEHN